MTVTEALDLLHLPSDFEIVDKSDLDEALLHWRVSTVRARDEKDDETSKVLSEAKEVLKSYYNGRYCPGLDHPCGRVKRKEAPYCPLCRRAKAAAAVGRLSSTTKTTNGATMTPPGAAKSLQKDWNQQPSEIVEIPPTKRHSPIRALLSTLAKPGDSIWMPCRTAHTIKQRAKALELIVMYMKEGIGYRVWRTDGKSIEEINEIIRQRKHKQLPFNNGQS
jgi:hypothetical protein